MTTNRRLSQRSLRRNGEEATGEEGRLNTGFLKLELEPT